MKILITGANGMVGRNLVESKLLKKYQLLTPTRQELNLLDATRVKEYLESHKPEFIIHCAGKVGGIQANLEAPYEFLYENLEMGKNLVHLAYHAGIKNVLNLGSSCIYPKDRSTPLKETDLLTGLLEPTNEGYAFAKIAVLKMCQYLNEHKGVRYKTAIPCNLYGPYDSFDENKSHLIPSIIAKLHAAKISGNPKVNIWGSGEARREFMYAGDCADFLAYAIHNFDQMPAIVNVGLGQDWSINEYYNISSEVMDVRCDFEHDLTRPTGMAKKLVDISLLNKFGWTPKTSLRNGIKMTYEYYLKLNTRR